MKTRKLLLGDEALALGAINGGLSGAYAYPGTPSTEILEYVQANPVARERGLHSHWSSNEKTAVEEALGMSFCGKRAIVSMKHVGLNVAADPFVNSAMTGANGGLLVISADDPSMHSSQNEQDSRFYARFAIMPVLEPSDQQEAYDMARYGFELSERLHIPVMVRLVTRLSHSRAVVEVDDEPLAENVLSYPDNARQWVLMPGNSRVRYRQLLADRDAMRDEAERSPFNVLTPGTDRRIGIIASGIAANYVNECFPGGCPFPMLKVSQYPLPKKKIAELADMCDAILVVEEGQPMIEDMMRGLLDRGLTIYGKLDGYLPATGELSPDSVAAGIAALAPEMKESLVAPENAPAKNVVARPPALCQGCGHRDVYAALNAALGQFESPKVFGDIGCYTLGAVAPRLARPVQRHRHLCRHGRLDHHGQRCRRRRPAPRRVNHRRLDLHTLGHDRPARRRQREHPHDSHYFRQPHHRHDRRPGLAGHRQARGNLPRPRCRPRPPAHHRLAPAQGRGDAGHVRRRVRLRRPFGNRGTARVHPDRPPSRQKEISSH